MRTAAYCRTHFLSSYIHQKVIFRPQLLAPAAPACACTSQAKLRELLSSGKRKGAGHVAHRNPRDQPGTVPSEATKAATARFVFLLADLFWMVRAVRACPVLSLKGGQGVVWWAMWRDGVMQRVWAVWIAVDPVSFCISNQGWSGDVPGSVAHAWGRETFPSFMDPFQFKSRLTARRLD
eukprot:1148257-Pelagomonas_calceolata.AAC.2